MKIVENEVKLISVTPNAPRLLAFVKNTRLPMAAQKGLRASDWKEEDLERELAYIANSIPSSWEFIDFTFLITNVSRAFTHQFVRNRTGSYAQESLRVVSVIDIPFVMPKRILEKGPESNEFKVMKSAVENIEHAMRALRDLGVAVEDARAILPTNVATSIVAKYNLRSLADLAKSRLGGRTQDEFREVFEKIVAAALKAEPWIEPFLFGDRDRDYFAEIERFAEEKFGGDLLAKGELLKIVDKMRKG